MKIVANVDVAVADDAYGMYRLEQTILIRIGQSTTEPFRAYHPGSHRLVEENQKRNRNTEKVLVHFAQVSRGDLRRSRTSATIQYPGENVRTGKLGSKRR